MDLPSQEVEIPMPLNSAYGGAHVHGHVTNMIHDHGHDHDHHHHHHHHHDHPSPPPPSSQFQAPSSNGPPMPMTQNHDHHQHDHQHHHLVLSNNTKKQQVRYRECLKNHAASMGGNATDGCGEFMPSGEEGTIEFLTCSACNCHRNFHRKEVAGDHHIPSSNSSPLLYDCHNYQFTQPPPHHLMINSRGRKVINLGQHKNMFYPSSATPAGGPRMIPYTMGPLLIPPDDQSDDQEELGGGVAASDAVACRALPPPPPPPPSSNQYYLHHSNHQHNQMMMMKKRFRTKFTAEQKEKMLSFAEKVGWKIQKQEESVVQQFCQEIGVKRRVLKVWMHNNKHNLAKKNSSISNA